MTFKMDKQLLGFGTSFWNDVSQFSYLDKGIYSSVNICNSMSRWNLDPDPGLSFWYNWVTESNHIDSFGWKI